MAISASEARSRLYLLRSPVNAQRLMKAVARDKSRQPPVVTIIEDLQALAGE